MQSLLSSNDATRFARATGAFGAMAAVRLEMGVRKWVDSGAAVNQLLFNLDPYVQVYIYGGTPDTFQIGYYNEGIFDGVAWHVTGYTAGPFPSDEFLIRFQFDAANTRISLEVWDYFGGRHLQKVINGVSPAAWALAAVTVLNTPVGTSDELDFVRLYSTNVALNAAPPTRVVAGAPVHAWEFEGNLNDTGTAAPINMAWQGGGAPAYGIEPFAPTTPPVLASATYATGGGLPDRVDLVFTNPNSGSEQESHVDVERRGLDGNWRAIGWALADATTYSDRVVKHATSYDYRVRARNRFGVTAYSNEVNAVTGAGADTNPIVVENAKPGFAGWALGNPAAAREIEGYWDLTSQNRGGAINLKVNSAAGAAFDLEVFRLGDYAGLGARRIRQVVGIAGTAQVIAAETGAYPNQLREQNWTTSYTLNLTDADPTEWTSGLYLGRLTQAGTGKQAFTIFCVRDDARQSRYLYNQPVNTYQAYNAWPMTAGVYAGRGLYGFNCLGGQSTTQVSFNRPYSIPDRADGAYGIGAGELLALLSIPNTLVGLGALRRTASSELNLLRFIEKEGYDVQYCTDLDLHASGESLWRRCYTLLFPGHQEYWTRQMRETVDAARDYGRHLDFFGANAAYWQIRLLPSALGGATANRNIYCAKLLASDPVGDAPTQTKTWRDLQGLNSSIEGEWKLVGVQYQLDPVLEEPMVIALTATDALSTAILAGTALSAGSVVPGVIGYEIDREDDAGESHSGIKPGRKLIANSPVTTGGHPDPRSHMTLYENSVAAGPAVHNGAVVVGAGTLGYAWALDDYGVGLGRPTSFAHAGVKQMTRNILGLQSEAVITEAGGGGGPGPGVATHLKIIQQPAGFAFGSSCTTPAILGVYDDDENEVTDFSGFISVVGLASVLSGPTRLRVYNGRATFRRLAGRTLGALTLAFSAPGLTGVNAAPVTVTAQTGTFRGVCELPRVVPVRRDPVAPVIQAVSGAALQAALNIASARTAANGGLLDRTFVVNDGTNPAYYWPIRPDDATGLISVEATSAPCPVGTRATAGMMGARARFESADGNVAAIATELSDGTMVAHHYRVAFVSAKMTDAAGSFFTLAYGTAGPDQDSYAKEPHHLYIDRCVIDGGDFDMRHTIMANCRYLCATDTSFLNGHHFSADGNAVACWNGSGEHFWGNCDIQGAAEGHIYGGADPSIPELIPSDITFDRCLISRPPEWNRNINPLTGWEVKNNIDTKNVQRLHEVGTPWENSWPDGQNGSLSNIKSVNQDGGAPWSGSSDIVIEGGVRRNAVICYAFGGTPEESKECSPLCRVWVENTAAVNIGTFATFGGGGTFDVTIVHNTWRGGAANPLGLSLHAGENDDAQVRFRYINNLHDVGSNGPVAAQDRFPPEVFGLSLPAAEFAGNVFSNPAAGWSATEANFPANNHLDGVTTASIGFTSIDETGWDTLPFATVAARLALLNSSPYHNAATDGTDIGANIPALLAAMDGGSPPPPTLVATSLGMVREAIGGPAGAAFPTQPQVEILDQFGARLTSSTVVVTANLYTGTGALIGTEAVAAIAGLVTWATLGGDTAGVKVIRYTSPGLTPVDGAAVTISAVGSPPFTWVTGPTRLSKPRHSLKQGDTVPSRRTQLLGADGTPQQLPVGTVVRYTLRGPDGNVIRRRAPATIEADRTTVVYDYQPADTAEFGLCTDEFEVTGPDSNVLTFPNTTDGTVKIRPQLA